MDVLDITLIKLLLANSRQSYRGLAETVGLSVNAVHKRIQTLCDQGTIRAFTTKISFQALSAIHILLSGQVESSNFTQLQDELGKHENIYWVTMASGNILYVGAYLQDIKDLGNLVDFVSKKGMNEPKIGIIKYDTPKTNYDLLQPLDIEILAQLRDDSRRSVADIATEIGVSAKTIRRRLGAIIDEGLAEFSLEWYPDSDNEILAFMHFKIESTLSKKEMHRLLVSYQPHAFFFWDFSNIPKEMVAIFWYQNTKEIREVTRRLTQEDSIVSCVPEIIYSGKIYPTWRDILLEMKK